MARKKKKGVYRWKRGVRGVRQTEVGKFEMPEKSERKYTQNWTAYNQAQTNEAHMFQDILIELIDSTIIARDPTWKNGRPFKNLKDMIFCCVMKVYIGKSSRRLIGHLKHAKEKGYIQEVPHFNTVLNYFKNPLLTNIIKHIVEQSGIPLKIIESQFATDASDFSTSLYGRWLDVRNGKQSQRRLYRKLHMTCGVITNIITAVDVTPGYFHDSPRFEGLVRTTAKNFLMKEMSADAGYLSRRNFDIVSSVGAIPYIEFRKNCTSSASGSAIYKRMFEYRANHRQEWLEHYHQRSNSETVFSMIKKKFGLRLYSRTGSGQDNEVLCLALSHNICVIIQEFFESGIEIDYSTSERVTFKRGYCAKPRQSINLNTIIPNF